MLTTIKTYRDNTDAHLDKSFLEANGISCFITDDSLVAADWFLSQAVGGVKLQVQKADVERAQKLLSR